MSIFDKLLETDARKLRMKEKKSLEVKRLSEVFEEPFIVTCTAMTDEQLQHIASISKEETYRANVILEACRVEGRKFSDTAWMEKMGVHSGEEVIRELFLAGEAATLHNTVSELSGYGKGAIEEVKN